MNLTFLGTSCMVPTKDRAQTAIVLEHKGELLLFDSGENVQRQFQLADLKPTRIGKIFLTHWHGDHVLGLPGLLQTLSSQEYSDVLLIFGPPGIKEKINVMMGVFDFDNRLKIEIHEVKNGRIYENSEYEIYAAPLKHRVPCLAYSFVLKDRLRIDLKKASILGLKPGPVMGKLQKGHPVKFKGREIKPEETTYVVKGKKITFVFDTLPVKEAISIAKGSDLLITEAVYTSELEEKAHEHKHLTAKQAALIAKESKSKQLILTHLSPRYKDKTTLLKEAKIVFPKTQLAKDFMKIKI